MLDSLEDLSDKLAMVRLEDNAKIDNGITRPKRELNWSLGKKKKPQKKNNFKFPKIIPFRSDIFWGKILHFGRMYVHILKYFNIHHNCMK